MTGNKYYSFLARCLVLMLFIMSLTDLSYSSGLFHTVQSGSFLSEDDALTEYDSILIKLDQYDLDNLRIEKIGQFYSVRLGRYDSYISAKEFYQRIKKDVPGAAVVKAYIKEERIVKAYSATPPEKTVWGTQQARKPQAMASPAIPAIFKKDNSLPLKDSFSKASLFDKEDLNAGFQNDDEDAFLDEGIAAITSPSEDMALSFIQPGLIDKVLVKEGQMVKKGQVLVQLDNEADLVLLSLIREKGEDRTQIDSQKASLAQKRIYLDKMEWAAKRGSATEMEVEEARLAVKIAEYSLITAEFDHAQNKKKYSEAKIRIDNMSLKSPIRGRVEKIEVEVGESIDGLASAVRVVKTDPLWLDVHVPLEKGKSLRLNQTAEVIFPGETQTREEGKVTFISTVADAASSTLRARIELPNRSNRTAGEHVSVLFNTP